MHGSFTRISSASRITDVVGVYRVALVCIVVLTAVGLVLAMPALHMVSSIDSVDALDQGVFLPSGHAAKVLVPALVLVTLTLGMARLRDDFPAVLRAELYAHSSAPNATTGRRRLLLTYGREGAVRGPDLPHMIAHAMRAPIDHLCPRAACTSSNRTGAFVWDVWAAMRIAQHLRTPGGREPPT